MRFLSFLDKKRKKHKFKTSLQLFVMSGVVISEENKIHFLTYLQNLGFSDLLTLPNNTIDNLSQYFRGLDSSNAV